MIKNYTSTIPVSRSVQHIEDRLVAHGARNIMKMYDNNKRLEGICFILCCQSKDIPFKLPARISNVEKVLRGAVKRPRDGTLNRIQDQAERTAWKIISDWVDIQISLIELQQVELLEVFLPYVYYPAERMTYFEKIQMGGYKLLTAE